MINRKMVRIAVAVGLLAAVAVIYLNGADSRSPLAVEGSEKPTSQAEKSGLKAAARQAAKGSAKRSGEAGAGGAVDPKLPKYNRVSGVSGTIKNEGSDTMIKLMQRWAEGFQRQYPNVQAEVQGKGSSSAPPALIAGTANFGSMSRPMKSKEIDEFEEHYGYKPTALKTSIDMLAVYVHKDCPLKGLSLPQVDAIYSKNRKGGYGKAIRTWGDLGLKGSWAARPIGLYGRNSASGTYGYFKEHALYNGDFKDSVQERPGSSAVVQAVARDKYGMGYSGIGYKTADVKAVPLSLDEGEDFVPAESDYAYSGDYPLSRFLYVYVNYEPGSQLDPLRREFATYIFSRQGQQEVVNEGYLPVTFKTAADSLLSMGIEPAP